MECGICLEPILKMKANFGILENCKHSFCLPCIQKWRKKTDDFDSEVNQACPVCRVKSDVVIPSTVGVLKKTDKDAIIAIYKENKLNFD